MSFQFSLARSAIEVRNVFGLELQLSILSCEISLRRDSVVWQEDTDFQFSLARSEGGRMRLRLRGEKLSILSCEISRPEPSRSSRPSRFTFNSLLRDQLTFSILLLRGQMNAFNSLLRDQVSCLGVVLGAVVAFNSLLRDQAW